LCVLVPGMRRFFQDFLESKHTEEYLLFWIHAEDYFQEFGDIPGRVRPPVDYAVMSSMVEHSRWV
jgi:hypothetical protein